MTASSMPAASLLHKQRGKFLNVVVAILEAAEYRSASR